MASFERRTFWEMLFWSLITGGLYHVYYNFHTAAQFRQAGGRVKSIIFWLLPYILLTFLGLLSIGIDFQAGLTARVVNIAYQIVVYSPLYFWFSYVQAYCQVIKQDVRSKTIWRHFMIWTIFSYSFWLLDHGFKFFLYLTNYQDAFNAFKAEHGVLSIATFFVLLYVQLNLAKYFCFQRGVNQYLKQ